MDPGNETILGSKERLLTQVGYVVEIPRTAPQFISTGPVEQSQEDKVRYWVIRRTARDTDDRGWYKRMEICSGPFATMDEAEAESQRRTKEHQRFLHDENVDKDIRKKMALEFVVYWAMSDDTIDEGRRRGIDIH